MYNVLVFESVCICSSSIPAGKYSILSAGGSDPLVQCYVACHPSSVDVHQDVGAVRRPGLFLLAESDWAFSASKLRDTKSILNGSQGNSAVFKEYEGTKHGFAIRGERVMCQPILPLLNFLLMYTYLSFQEVLTLK